MNMLDGKTSPCKGCSERHEACHGHCEKYLEFAQRLREKNKALDQWKSETYKERMSLTDPPKKKRNLR